jgi:hypothetical protein
MKIGNVIVGLAIIGMQLVDKTLVNWYWFTHTSFFLIGMMLIIEGIAKEPRFDRIEEHIWNIKEEIVELKFPHESNNED